MRRIGIDARLYSQTGVGVYIRNLLHYLDSVPRKNTEFYVYVLAEDVDKVQFHNSFFQVRVVNARWHSLAEQVTFLWTLYRDNLDLMHFTYFSHPVLYHKPFIATIHDSILLQMKTGKASTKSAFLYEVKHVAFSVALKNQVSRSLNIITPTEEIKKQLVLLYGKKYESKISAIYEGVNFELQEASEIEPSEEVKKKPFFMYVGNFYPHKNVERLIDAYRSLDTSTQLLLIGPNDFFSKRLKAFLDENKINNIIFKHGVPNGELKWYYRHAEALIHPSLSEGFGLPLIEAQYFRCPIIASNIPVFQELLGNGYLAFNERDTADIARVIREFMQRSKGDVKKEEPILNKNFSFKSMTENIFSLYETSDRV